MNDAIKKNVLIDSIDKVKRFAAIMSKESCAAELKSDSYIVDAKSIMGIFSLDVSKPVELVIHGTSNTTDNTIEELACNGFIVD